SMPPVWRRRLRFGTSRKGMVVAQPLYDRRPARGLQTPSFLSPLRRTRRLARLLTGRSLRNAFALMTHIALRRRPARCVEVLRNLIEDRQHLRDHAIRGLGRR